MSEDKKHNIALSALFIAWIFGLFAGHIVISDRDFSEMENRTLSAFPKFSPEALFSGKYGDDFESYLNDQFPLRDLFKRAGVAVSYAAAKRDIGGTYVLGDGLMSKTVVGGMSRTDDNIESLLRLDGSLQRAIALIPDASCIFSDRLPYGAPQTDQRRYIDEAYERLRGAGFAAADVAAALDGARDERIFYDTDHHWTTLGAFYGYQKIASALGFEPLSRDRYSLTTLSDEFYGSLYSKAPAFWIEPDEIFSMVPDYGSKVTAFDGAKNMERSIYVMENLEKKDKYAVFLGGNQPLITIDSSARAGASAPKLLALRDSYFDSLAPFLQEHFSTIYMIDTRYYRRDVADFIEENGVDCVLAAYSVEQFADVMDLDAAIW